MTITKVSEYKGVPVGYFLTGEGNVFGSDGLGSIKGSGIFPYAREVLAAIVGL